MLDTAVTGDIRGIGEDDFSSLERGELRLPHGVYGGICYELQRISDGLDFIRAVYLFNKRRPELEYYCYATLSGDSPDWYDSVDDGYDEDTPPFDITFVEAGSRIGYRWETNYDGGNPCEVNWLDPEPSKKVVTMKNTLKNCKRSIVNWVCTKDSTNHLQKRNTLDYWD